MMMMARLHSLKAGTVGEPSTEQAWGRRGSEGPCYWDQRGEGDHLGERDQRDQRGERDRGDRPGESESRRERDQGGSGRARRVGRAW
jgi:hypothetical protein